MADRNLVVVGNHELDLVSEPRLKMIRDKFANGAPQHEFELFIEVARTVQLDPLKRQIYLIPRSSKDRNGKWVETWAIQTSIDGYRSIADRTGAYAGSDDAVFTESGQKVTSGKDEWATTKPRPDAATVTVWKIVQGQRCPFTATARWDEYYQEKSPLWGKMPHTMLGKCAESLALRKAFPEQLSGVYTDTEMDQAGLPAEPVQRPSQAITEARRAPSAPINVPTEIVEVQARPVPNRQAREEDRENANRKYFALTTDRGFTDAANKLLALAMFPERENGPTTSRTQLTAGELTTLTEMVDNETTQALSDEGEIIPLPDPAVEFANAIAAATDQKQLATLGAKMKSDGVGTIWLRRMYKHRNGEVPAASEAQPAINATQGSAGLDRHTS